MATFAQRFKELRELNEMTQRELAAHLGISKSSVSLYETGERKPDLDALKNICDFFNVDMDYMTGAEGVSMRYLTAKEMQLIDKYRKSSAGTQFAIDRLLGIKMTADDVELLDSLVGDEHE